MSWGYYAHAIHHSSIEDITTVYSSNNWRRRNSGGANEYFTSTGHTYEPSFDQGENFSSNWQQIPNPIPQYDPKDYHYDRKPENSYKNHQQQHEPYSPENCGYINFNSSPNMSYSSTSSSPSSPSFIKENSYIPPHPPSYNNSANREWNQPNNNASFEQNQDFYNRNWNQTANYKPQFQNYPCNKKYNQPKEDYYNREWKESQFGQYSYNGTNSSYNHEKKNKIFSKTLKNVPILTKNGFKPSGIVKAKNKVPFNAQIASGFKEARKKIPAPFPIPQIPQFLYHYTDSEGAFGILEDKFLRPKENQSIGIGTSQRFGQGIYFTALPPSCSTEDILKNNYGTHRIFSSQSSKTEFCFEFKSSELQGVKFCEDPIDPGHRRKIWMVKTKSLSIEGMKGFYYSRFINDKLGIPDNVTKFSWDSHEVVEDYSHLNPNQSDPDADADAKPKELTDDKIEEEKIGSGLANENDGSSTGDTTPKNDLSKEVNTGKLETNKETGVSDNDLILNNTINNSNEKILKDSKEADDVIIMPPDSKNIEVITIDD